MHRLAYTLSAGIAAAAIGAGEVGAQALRSEPLKDNPKVIGFSPCDNETYECKDRRTEENGANVVSAFRAEFAATPACAGLSLGRMYVTDKEKRWALWLPYAADRARRTWTLRPPGGGPWFNGEGTMHEIAQAVCGIVNGLGGKIIDE